MRAAALLFACAVVTPNVQARVGDGGRCCFLCAGRECVGCWGPASFCSQSQEICQSHGNCEGMWQTDPIIVPDPRIQAPLLPQPHAVYTDDHLENPGIPVIVGDYFYVYNGMFEIVYDPSFRITPPWLEKRKLSTGDLVWRANIDDPYKIVPYFTYPPQLSGDQVFFQITYAVYGPTIIVLDDKSGRQDTNITLSVLDSASAVSVSDGKLFYMSNTSLVARDSVTSAVSWDFQMGISIGDCTRPAVAGGLVFKTGVSSSASSFAGSQAFYVYALHAESGIEAWPLLCRTMPWMTRIAESDQIVYVGVTFFDVKLGLPFGQPESLIIALNKQTGGYVWTKDIGLAGVTKQPALSPVEEKEPVIVLTTCTKPMIAGAPPVWWLDCELYAIDTNRVASIATGSLRDSIMWRYKSDASVVFSQPIVKGGAVFVSGVTFVNGSWPNCSWPYSKELPTCNVTGNWTQLPHYAEPFLMALRVSDGRLLWKTYVDLGNWTIPNLTNVETMVRHSVGWTDSHEDLLETGEVDAARDEARRKSSEFIDEDSMDFAGMLTAFAKRMPVEGSSDLPSLLPLPWCLIPWNGFHVDATGKSLAYATYDGLVMLDVAARGEDDNSDVSWMAPLAGASAGLALIVSIVVIARKTCSDEEAALSSSEREALLQKRAKEAYYPAYPGSFHGTDGSGRTGSTASDTARTSPEEEYGYEVIRQLGKGGFGNVYLVKRRAEDGALYSLKKIVCRCDRELRVAQREVSILTTLPEHPGQMKIVESFAKDGCVFMIMPYFAQVYSPTRSPHSSSYRTTQGDLAGYIGSYPDPVLPEVLVVSFARQIAEVLAHLNSQTPPVVHRDLKPENILITDDRQHVVVADFGLSRLVDKTYMHTHAGTMAFMAPESFDGPYDTKVDIWSLGCVLYAMCMKRSRHSRVMCVHVGRRGFHAEIADSITERGYSPLVVDLVRQTLQASRHARPSAEEVVYRLGDDAPAPLKLGAQTPDHDPASSSHPSLYKMSSLKISPGAACIPNCPPHTGCGSAEHVSPPSSESPSHRPTAAPGVLQHQQQLPPASLLHIGSASAAGSTPQSRANSNTAGFSPVGVVSPVVPVSGSIQESQDFLSGVPQVDSDWDAYDDAQPRGAQGAGLEQNLPTHACNGSFKDVGGGFIPPAGLIKVPDVQPGPVLACVPRATSPSAHLYNLSCDDSDSGAWSPPSPPPAASSPRYSSFLGTPVGASAGGTLGTPAAMTVLGS